MSQAFRLASLRLRDCRWCSAHVGQRVWLRIAGLLQFRHWPSSLAFCRCSWARRRLYSLRSGLLLLARSYSRRRISLASCAAGPLLSVSRLLLSGWGEWCGFSFLREGLAEGLRDPFPFGAGRLTISGLDRVLAFFPLRLGSGNRMVCEKVCGSKGSIPFAPGSCS